MNYKNSFLPFFFFCFILSPKLFAFSYGKPIYKNLNTESLIKSYYQVEKQFLAELCSGKTEEDFNKKFKTYLGSGFYLPKIDNNKLDLEAIRKSLPDINRKVSWIQNEINSLSRFQNFKSELENLESIKVKFDELVELKSKHYHNIKEAKRLKTISKYKFIEFREDFNSFLRSISFLRYVDFPVNYFELRKVYDALLSDPLKVREKESWYLKRKIFEDGAQDADHTKSDFYLRSVISMTVIRMEERHEFLPADLYYDLEYLFKAITNSLNRGLVKHKERMQEWLARTQEMQKYYESFLRLNETEAANFSLLVQIDEARQDLKKFVYEKQAMSYEFWSKQSEIHQALFSLETILQNEVGGIDGALALDRQDVVQVVINRLLIPQYLEVSNKDDFFPYLDPQLQKNAKKYPWLNVLLKQGEFSFTYFFLSASAKVFCPAQNPASKNLREENLRLIVQKLQAPDWSFPATRYFSRASMTGRIDMSSLWPKHQALEERNGPELPMEHSAYRGLEGEALKVIYDFKAVQKKSFWVVKIDDQFYVYGPADKKLYFYRDPHLFRYFQSRYL